MATQPIDQGAILRSGAALLPDLSEQIMRERLISIQEQQAQQQSGALALRQAEALREQQQRTAYQTAVQELGERPSLDGIASLMLRFPEASEAARRAYESLDSNQQRTEFRAAAELHSALVNNTPEVAARILRTRIEADRAGGGEPDQVDQLMLDAIESGDPQRLATARSLARRNAAIMAGPQQFASVYGADEPNLRNIGAGDVLYDEDRGAVVFESPYVRGADGVLYERRPSGGGGGAGRSGVSRGERNMNPGNIEDGSFARSQPGYVGSDGRFARFDTAENGIRAQENLLRRNYAGQPLRRIIERYSPRSENGEATDNYIAYVARRMGVEPDTTISEARIGQLAAAMREFETGNRSSGSGSGNAPVRVRSMQEAMALPSGTQFYRPDTNEIRTRN